MLRDEPAVLNVAKDDDTPKERPELRARLWPWISTFHDDLWRAAGRASDFYPTQDAGRLLWRYARLGRERQFLTTGPITLYGETNSLREAVLQELWHLPQYSPFDERGESAVRVAIENAVGHELDPFLLTIEERGRSLLDAWTAWLMGCPCEHFSHWHDLCTVHHVLERLRIALTGLGDVLEFTSIENDNYVLWTLSEKGRQLEYVTPQVDYRRKHWGSKP